MMLRLAAALTLCAAPLAAQDFYGHATLSFGQSDTVGTPVGLQGADGTSVSYTHLTLPTIYSV